MFSAEYKAEAVRLVGDSDKSIGVIALELGLGETALRRWVQQAVIDDGAWSQRRVDRQRACRTGAVAA
jgi:transposase-like protein